MQPTLPTPRPRRRRTPGTPWRRVAQAAAACVAAVAASVACEAGPEPDAPAPSGAAVPAETTLRLEGVTDAGHYRVRTRPAEPPVELHVMHDWIVGIELVDPAAPIPTAVRFDGGMPSHGHGFVTQPRVTRNLGGGEFLVEGVKFHMPGDWVLRITVASRDGSELVTLPLSLEP